MTDSNGYLSKDRDYLNKGQRERRARMVRVDYMPRRQSLAAMEAKRGPRYPLCTNSGILDAIVCEWGELTGIKYKEISRPMSPATRPELIHASARANDFGDWLAKHAAAAKAAKRVICGAKTQSGNPCRGKSLPGTRRCKWHGGMSTGPRTAEGKQERWPT